MYVSTRMLQRMTLTTKSRRPRGHCPVKSTATNAIASDTVLSAYSTIKCGIARIQLTSGRQFATFSGGSNVNVAGYGALIACMRHPPVVLGRRYRSGVGRRGDPKPVDAGTTAR